MVRRLVGEAAIGARLDAIEQQLRGRHRDRDAQVAEMEQSIGEIQECHRRLLVTLMDISDDRWLAAKLFGVLLLLIFMGVLWFS